jgi:lipid-A-disaccharide synthase
MRHLIEPLRRQHAPDVPLELLDGLSHEALAACDLTLVASGTATLEAALFKRPMVIVYVMHPLNWQLMKRMKYQPWVGLPNILLNDFAVPEYLQGQATPEHIARAGLSWLDEPDRVRALQGRFEELHRSLRCNTGERATDEIQTILAR